jgi:hypothetical protein
MELLMSLLKSPSWALLVEVYQKQVGARLNETANQPLLSMEDAMQRNYKLGLAHGIQLAARMPTDMYNEIYRVYTDKLEELRDESAPAQ